MEGRSKSLLVRAAGLFVAAVGGGAIALGGAAALGKLGRESTTVREVAQAPAASESVAFAKPRAKALTINEIYQRSAPGVVQVTSTSVVASSFDPFTNPFAPLTPQTQQSLGSGFVVDKVGHIVTNYHVVQGAREIDVSFSNHESMRSRLVGIGFAIPINTVKTVAASLIKQGRVEHAYIGIDARGIDETLARIFRLPVSQGLLVEEVRSGSPAADSGLRGGDTQVTVAGVTYNLGGDVIVRADGEKISSLARLRSLLAGKKPGDKLRLALYRGTKRIELTVTLGRQPASPSG